MKKPDGLAMHQIVTTPENLYDSGLTAEISPFRMLCHIVDQTVRDTDPQLQLVIQQAKLPPDQFEALCRVRMAHLRMTGQIRKCEEFYCKDGVANLKLASYDLNVFLGGLAKQLNDALGVHTQGEIVYRRREEGELLARFDADRVCAILYNLVDNAIIHGNTQNKNVYISLKTTKDTIIISVKDKGQGVPEQEKAILFKKYAYNFEMPTFPPSSDLKGLGLALCRKYAREMGGEIKHENQKTGAKFSLILPRYVGRQTGFREVCVYEYKLYDLMCFMSESLMMVDRTGQK